MIPIDRRQKPLSVRRSRPARRSAKAWIWLFCFAASVPAASPLATAGAQQSATDLQRAKRNYADIQSGAKRLRDLPEFERRELLEYIRLAEQTKNGRPRTEKCVAEEKKKLGRAPSDLDQRAIAKRCRAPGRRRNRQGGRLQLRMYRGPTSFTSARHLPREDSHG